MIARLASTYGSSGVEVEMFLKTICFKTVNWTMNHWMTFHEPIVMSCDFNYCELHPNCDKAMPKLVDIGLRWKVVRYLQPELI